MLNNKPMIDKFRTLADDYKKVAAELNVSLQELLLMILSEQLNDIFVTAADDPDDDLTVDDVPAE